jgi:hypothetical protein
MSPYIITMKQECDQPACERVEPCDAERSGWCAHPHSDDGFGNRTPLSRRVVATHYDVWDAVPAEARKHLVGMNPSGGTIGPLPDGTVIEVAPVGLEVIAGYVTDAGHDITDWSDDSIIATFNADQAVNAARQASS